MDTSENKQKNREEEGQRVMKVSLLEINPVEKQ
jgi:hypothetical protein